MLISQMIQHIIRYDNLKQAKYDTEGSFYGSCCGLGTIFEVQDKIRETGIIFFLNAVVGLDSRLSLQRIVTGTFIKKNNKTNFSFHLWLPPSTYPIPQQPYKWHQERFTHYYLIGRSQADSWTSRGDCRFDDTHQNHYTKFAILPTSRGFARDLTPNLSHVDLLELLGKLYPPWKYSANKQPDIP